MNYLSILFLSISMLANYTFGQSKESFETISELDDNYISEQNYKQLFLEQQGTFQLRYNVPGLKPLLEKTIMARIASERLQSEDVLIVLSQNVTLFLPSYDTINSIDFIPLVAEKYVGMTNSVIENQ